MKKWVQSVTVLSFLCFFGLCFIASAQAQTVYVKPTGSNSNTGLSWALAKQTVTAGLTTAVSGDQVWVAAGTYNERITLKAGVALYGGFVGTETDLSQRNFASNLTILDGQQGGRVVTSPSGATTTTRIDGFTIRNGKISNNANGGGIYCNNSSPTISNNIISGNSTLGYGGGICCYSSSSPIISNNTISGNTASSWGGGIICWESSSPTITSNTISGNTASYGSGIYCRNSSSPTITSNTISGNTASNYGGGIYCYSSSPTIISNTISGNSANSSGGNGGGICCSSSSPIISNNTISRNSASFFGGGIYCASSSQTISGNIIIENSVSVYGGGIYCASSSSPAITSNTISGNSAPSKGGAIYCASSSPIIISNNIISGSSGGGIYCASSSPTISSNTISGNNASGIYGGGISCESSAPTIANNIIAFNNTGIYKSSTGTPVLHNNCVFNPGGYNYSGLSAGPGDINNIDPKMEAPEYGKYHLKSDSICIDAGNDTDIQSGQVDMDGLPRIVGTHADIGADEYDGTVYTFTPSIIRVKTSGNDTYNGSTWALAKQTVQAGIDTASATGGEVWVAEGTYNERITLRAFAYIYGGFAGTETQHDQRDFKIHTTVLDGQQGGSVVTATACGHQISRIDGFTIQNGIGTISGSYRFGGGIYCSGSSPTISNNIISGNIAFDDFGGWGGGIYCSGSSPTISNNIISGNKIGRGGSGGYGGGIYCGSSSPTIINNTISGNSADGQDGSGIYCSGSSPTIANNIIAFNSTGIYKYSGSGTPVLRNNCVFNPGGYNYSGLSAGPNDIQQDPKLEAPEYHKYHLRPDSNCIGMGNNTDVQSEQVDIDGLARVVGTHVDIGADEYDGTNYSFTPTIVRVNTTGSDTNDGSTWALAKRTVQAGIDAAAATGGEVWVAEGTYNGCITLQAFAYLYGGFAGTETQRDQRDFQTHLTILDGQQSGSVVTSTTSGYQISRIDGFTIQNGTGTLSGGGDRQGGGIYCDNSSPAISNNTISGNTAYSGGGIYCYYYSFPTISNNNISGNTASGGGGIRCYYYSFPTINNNTISENNASSNGGISCYYHSSPTICNNTISGNNASGNNAGGIGCDNYSSPTIANNIIAFNGTGIRKYSGSGTPVLRNNCVFNTTYNYSDLSAGPNDIQQDPLFVSLAESDFHLTEFSPCRDAGNDADVQPGWLDMDGQARIYGSYVDIGADEFYSVPTFTFTGTVELQNYIPGPAGVSVSVIVDGGIPMIKTLDAESKFTLTGMTAGTYNIYVKASHWLSQTQPIVVSEDTLAEYSLKNGDADNDDFIDNFDLGMIAENWLEQIPSLIEPGADLNGDELVNGLDFCIMGANWYLSGE